MSLSILSTHTPSICPITRHRTPTPPIDWARVRDATLAAAAATALSQIPSAPVDLASKLINATPTSPRNLPAALLHLFATHGLSAFRNLPLTCIKRVPTKALTVALFELATHRLTRPPCPAPLSPLHHLSVAIPAGALGLALTFPLHALYYANRKGVPCSAVLSAFAANRRLMFSGALPALLSTPPAVIVDYAVYRTLRSHIDTANQSILSLPAPVWIVAAATAANLTGGACVEPLKALSRRMAADSVKAATSHSMSATAKSMMQNGVGEFWKGYPTRMVRYAVSAVVSKTVVRQLRRRSSAKIASGAMSSFVTPERRVYPALIYPFPVARVSALPRMHQMTA